MTSAKSDGYRRDGMRRTTSSRAGCPRLRSHPALGGSPLRLTHDGPPPLLEPYSTSHEQLSRLTSPSGVSFVSKEKSA